MEDSILIPWDRIKSLPSDLAGQGRLGDIGVWVVSSYRVGGSSEIILSQPSAPRVHAQYWTDFRDKKREIHISPGPGDINFVVGDVLCVSALTLQTEPKGILISHVEVPDEIEGKEQAEEGSQPHDDSGPSIEVCRVRAVDGFLGDWKVIDSERLELETALGKAAIEKHEDWFEGEAEWVEEPINSNCPMALANMLRESYISVLHNRVETYESEIDRLDL